MLIERLRANTFYVATVGRFLLLTNDGTRISANSWGWLIELDEESGEDQGKLMNKE